MLARERSAGQFGRLRDPAAPRRMRRRKLFQPNLVPFRH
jgi:hypothetical protein